MKTLEPFQFWINGKIVTAYILQVSCNYDNLKDSAIFYYALYDNNLIKLTDGNLSMNLPDYATDWSSNNSAYLWAATQLGLTITGDYVAPV
jgi:hypothetical protein